MLKSYLPEIKGGDKYYHYHTIKHGDTKPILKFCLKFNYNDKFYYEILNCF